MQQVFFRTDRTFVAPDGRAVDIRTFIAASSAAAARVASRRGAVVAAGTLGATAEIVGLESTVEVPGVTNLRAPEVRIGRKWRRVTIASHLNGDA